MPVIQKLIFHLIFLNKSKKLLLKEYLPNTSMLIILNQSFTCYIIIIKFQYGFKGVNFKKALNAFQKLSIPLPFKAIRVIFPLVFSCFWLYLPAQPMRAHTEPVIPTSVAPGNDITYDSLQTQSKQIGTRYLRGKWTTATLANDFLNIGSTPATVDAKGHIIIHPLTAACDIYQPNKLEVNNPTCLENWVFYVKMRLPVPNTTTCGIGIGLCSINSNIQNSFAFEIRNSSGTESKEYLNFFTQSGSIWQGRQPTNRKLKFADTDYIAMRVERANNIVKCTAWNLTVPGASIDTTYVYSYGAVAPFMANTGNFTIAGLGAQAEIDSISITSSDVKNAELMALGDSKTQGSNTSDPTKAWSYLLRKIYQNYAINAGGGDDCNSILARLNGELKDLAPKQVLLDIGTNDVNEGHSFATIMSQIRTIVKTLTGRGAKVFVHTEYQTFADLQPLRDSLYNAYNPTGQYVDTWGATMVPGALNADGIHPTDLGHSLIYQMILKSVLFANGTTVTTIDAPSATLTNASLVNYTINFASLVTGLTASNFSLTTTGITGASISSVVGSGIIDTLTVNTGTGDGTITLNLVNATGLSPGLSTPLPFVAQNLTIDKTAPVINISPPSFNSTHNRPVSYQVTYSDQNFKAATLTPADVILNATGNATGAISVAGSGNTFVVTISQITGTGSIGISLAARTSSDMAGNFAAASGPSATFSVSPFVSTDAVLSSIMINNAVLTPSFSPGVLSYSVTVPFTTKGVSVKPISNNSGAKIEVNSSPVISGITTSNIPLVPGANTIIIRVVAEDGITTSNYTITVNRMASANADLSALTISNGTLSPVFAAGTTSCSAAVDYSIPSINITPVLSDTSATLAINGVSASSGIISQSILLNTGENLISVVVTAQNNSIKKYTILVTRAIPAILMLPVTNFKLTVTGASCKGSDNGSVEITAAQSSNYIATISRTNLNNSYSFTNTQTIQNLAAGSYTICIAAAGQTGYEDCFNVVITEPQDISVYSTINADLNSVNLVLSGGTRYNISLNNTLYTTSNSNITLPLKTGNNNLLVTTDKLCQGQFQRLINLSGNIAPYPNPFLNNLNVNLGEYNIKNLKIEIHNLSNGMLVYAKTMVNQCGVLQLDLTAIRSGVYSLYVLTDESERVFKIQKQ